MVEFALNNVVHASTGFTPFLPQWVTTPSRVTHLTRRYRGFGRTRGRGSEKPFLPGLGLCSAEGNQLKHCFIGPVTALTRNGAAWTIDLPKSMTTHPTFYMGRLKRYHDPQAPAAPQEAVGGHVEDGAALR
ncbi:hypothetical protein ON010_g16961 [Phytophthora cinnamomi]|nr:hypothetical protein ON010_g16961 [Phytophthora cinnamomi]